MPRNVIPIRGSVEEKAEWDEAASNAGMAFSAWARRALNEAAQSDLVDVREAARQKEQRLRLVEKSHPKISRGVKPVKCIHGIDRNMSFCPRCTAQVPA